MTNLNELLPITNQGNINTVNARDLHCYLEVGKVFAAWIRDVIDKYNFVENEDYLVISNFGKNPSGGRPTIDYYVTLDVAKEICMVSRSDRGREARRYFIECEKQLQALQPKLPANYKEALVALVAQIEETEKKEAELLIARPKATYYDNVLNSTSLVNISVIAKDYGMSATGLNKLLHDYGVIYKDKDNIWKLYSKHQAKGYTHSSTVLLENGSTKMHTKWTQRGRLFIYNTLKEQGILPIVEQGENK